MSLQLEGARREEKMTVLRGLAGFFDLMIVDYLGGNLFLFIDVILGRRRPIEESRSLWMLGRGLRWYEIRGLGPAFCAFVAAAIALRRRAGWHRRLMLSHQGLS
jgi:hypothetical protein